MKLPSPDLQIGFAIKLRASGTDHLQAALLEQMAKTAVASVDLELTKFASPKGLAALASKGLRGELVYATPTLLCAYPKLLGYYRLLLGYSQKAFYGRDVGLGRFKGMETSGQLNAHVAPEIQALCAGLCGAANELLDGLEGLDLSAAFFNDLALLTLGPQFRGGANNAIGQGGVRDVFSVISGIVANADPVETEKLITLKNAAGRQVLIEFGADPDVTVQVALEDGVFAKVLAIEIKAGSDGSNRGNRLGEAEKSHLSAKANGFTVFWTIENTSGFDEAVARGQSPTTSRFYRLADLTSGLGPSYTDFRNRLLLAIGLS